jgi:hypothetical protein
VSWGREGLYHKHVAHLHGERFCMYKTVTRLKYSLYVPYSKTLLLTEISLMSNQRPVPSCPPLPLPSSPHLPSLP